MEALALRVDLGEIPRRGFYVALGHDEEINGLVGAKTIAEYLTAENVKLEFILDEGLKIARNSIPGITIPVALWVQV